MRTQSRNCTRVRNQKGLYWKVYADLVGQAQRLISKNALKVRLVVNALSVGIVSNDNPLPVASRYFAKIWLQLGLVGGYCHRATVLI